MHIFAGSCWLNPLPQLTDAQPIDFQDTYVGLESQGVVTIRNDSDVPIDFRCQPLLGVEPRNAGDEMVACTYHYIPYNMVRFLGLLANK